MVDGRPRSLGARAFDVLQALIERRERVVTKNELLDLVWAGMVVEENNLQVQISALRKVLGSNSIATVPGRGYRFTGVLEPVDLQSFPQLANHLVPIDNGAPSIAVLPFMDFSPEKDQEYFTDGLAEELLNVLTKIRGLRVASRTSAFYFKGKNVDVPTIAQKLNVATILEGSVRKAGNRARITVQLVQVATDSHLWSETYDRELEDIFAVQHDIAQSVVTELRSALLGETPDVLASATVRADVHAATKGRGENAEAYRLYLQGRFFEDRLTREDTAEAIGYYQQAVAIDPNYALAWAGISRAYASKAGFGWEMGIIEGFEKAREAAQRALQEQPELVEALLANGWICMYYDWDWKGADAFFHRALELSPDNAQALRDAAVLAADVGRLEDAVALLRRAAVLDPLSLSVQRARARLFVFANLMDEAEAAAKMVYELNPTAQVTRHLGFVRLAQGRQEEALELFQNEGDEYDRLYGIALVEFARGQTAESDAALSELIEHNAASGAIQIAVGYAYRGEADLAFEWLERAYTQRDPGTSMVKVDPMLRGLHADPRWQPFLVKMGLAD